MITTRTAWFPLRSNIAFFEAPTPSIDLSARIKQMALLSDTLYFEPGLLEVTVADEGRAGISESWISADHLAEEDIRRRREASRQGQPFQLMVARQPAKGVAADPTTAIPLIQGPISRSFVAEFHLLLQESGLESQPWMEWMSLNDQGQQIAAEMEREADLADRVERDLYPAVTESTQLDERLRKGLNRDLIWSSLIESPAVVDELHQPLLEVKSQLHPETGREPVPGAHALRLWAPNFTALPWKRIIELHDHEAVGAFREKLIEAEESVAPLPDDERDAALKDIGYQAALKKVDELTTTVLDVAADVTASSLVDLMPWGGTIYSAATGIARVRRERSDWMAVLVSLNKGA